MIEENTAKIILIIDDDESIREVLNERIKSWGYEVLTAGSGEEGIKIAKEKLPSLILLDIMMPEMKGRDVCEKLKADSKTSHIPVIFLTALNLADHIKAGMDLGAEDYITKPYKSDELKDRIMVCLSRHRNSG